MWHLFQVSYFMIDGRERFKKAPNQTVFFDVSVLIVFCVAEHIFYIITNFQPAAMQSISSTVDA